MSSVPTELACPGCSRPLLVSDVAGERRYDCPICGVLMCGMALFSGYVGSARAQQVSAGATGGTPEARCPFCGNLMSTAALPRGQVWMCRSCEMVVLDRQARGDLISDQRLAVAPDQGFQMPDPAAAGQHHGRARQFAEEVLEGVEAVEVVARPPGPFSRRRRRWTSGPTQ